MGGTGLRWVLAMSDPGSAARLAAGLSQASSPPAQVCWAPDGPAALALVRREMPDLLAADLALPGLEGAALFQRVGRLSLPTLPWAVGLSLPGMEDMERIARNAGACLVLQKPLPAPWLCHAVESLAPDQRLPRRQVTVGAVERALWQLGFSAASRGTRYLAMAAELCGRDMALCGRLTGTVYPLVARKAGQSAQRVEHAIRRAIDAAWAGGPREAQYRLFGNTIEAKRGKPTAGGMIARMAELLRTGMEIES